MENKNLNILDEVNKGATMGMDAISFVSQKVTDSEFKQALDTEYNKYKKISQRVNDLYSDYTDKEPHETNTMNKMMTWYGIQMKTITDDSTTHLSELLMQGTNMGIIKGNEILRGARVQAQDLRGGAALVLAGLMACGETVVKGTDYIERGYSSLTEGLRMLGADIDRCI